MCPFENKAGSAGWTRFHSRLKGKVERSHRVDDQEFYQLLDQHGVRDDIHLFNEKLREWQDYYHYHPGGRWLGALDDFRNWLVREAA